MSTAPTGRCRSGRHPQAPGSGRCAPCGVENAARSKEFWQRVHGSVAPMLDAFQNALCDQDCAWQYDPTDRDELRDAGVQRPEELPRIQAAIARCQACPILLECRFFGREHDLLGVFGGEYLGVA